MYLVNCNSKIKVQEENVVWLICLYKYGLNDWKRIKFTMIWDEDAGKIIAQYV